MPFKGAPTYPPDATPFSATLQPRGHPNSAQTETSLSAQTVPDACTESPNTCELPNSNSVLSGRHCCLSCRLRNWIGRLCSHCAVGQGDMCTSFHVLRKASVGPQGTMWRPFGRTSEVEE